jgi:hypothetical protein
VILLGFVSQSASHVDEVLNVKIVVADTQRGDESLKHSSSVTQGELEWKGSSSTSFLFASVIIFMYNHN